MRTTRTLILGSLALIFLGSLTLSAYGYELLYPLHKWGDPDEPVEYRLNVDRNEAMVPGDAEFDDVRASFQNWEDIGTRLAFYEGPNHNYCDFEENGLNEVAFDECGGECTGACIAVTRSITDAVVDQMWQDGPDGMIKVRAKYDADILFNATTNFWSPVEGNCTGYQFSVVAVATHEIGHLLGLGHSDNGFATMEATIGACSRLEETLHEDDIAGLQQLYSTDSEEFAIVDQENGVIATSVVNAGNFGYSSSGGRWGRGFEWPAGTNNIYEGGLIIGIPTADKPSDDFRMHGPNGQDADFLQQSGFTILDYSDPLRVTSCEYDDSVAEDPIGVSVQQRSFIFPEGQDEDYFIMQYHVTNESGATLTGMNVGIMIDWDLQDEYLDNTVSYYSDIGLGHVSDPSTIRRGGACVLNPEGVATYRALYAINNDELERYTDTNKQSWLFSGFDRTEIAGDDIAMLIATGPFTIPPGETATAAFAVLVGENTADIRENCLRAKAKYLQIQYFASDINAVEIGDGTMKPTLAQNRPNPFRSGTEIGFSILRPGRVRLDIYDVSGRLIRSLVDTELTKERYAVRWDRRNDAGERVSPGVYLYRLVTPDNQQHKKLLVVE